MKLREREERLDPRVERELDAVDRALAGREVDPDLAGWEELTALLEQERAEPEPEWAKSLDRRARARFRGGSEDGSSRSLAARLDELRPMRLLAPAGALATLAVVAIVALSTLGGGGSGSDSGGPVPTAVDATSTTTTSSGGAPAQTEESATADSGTALPPIVDDGGVGRASIRAGDASGSSLDQSLRERGKIAPGTERRQIERDVRLALSTQPDQVRDVSDEVISVTRSLDGIVASSQVTEAGRRSSATLELTLPTRNLDAAIDQLTDLANVESLNEATLDITKPYVSAQDRLRDAKAQRSRLLDALAGATTDAEAAALQQRIDDARREISRAESAFESIARRARLSDLSVTVTGDPNAKDERSLGDWLADAGNVLRDVVGVLLVTAAIVVPLGILIALAWFVVSRVRRSRRERALDA